MFIIRFIGTRLLGLVALFATAMVGYWIVSLLGYSLPRRLHKIDFALLALLGLGVLMASGYCIDLMYRNRSNIRDGLLAVSAPKAKTSIDHVYQHTDECVGKLADKWLYYNEVLKFKPDVPLSEVIESFAMPALEFVRNEYPNLHRVGPRYFWMMIFSAIQKTGYPSPRAIQNAVTELSVKVG